MKPVHTNNDEAYMPPFRRASTNNMRYDKTARNIYTVLFTQNLEQNHNLVVNEKLPSIRMSNH